MDRRNFLKILTTPMLLTDPKEESEDRWFDHWLAAPGQRIVATIANEGFTYYNGTGEAVEVVLWRSRPGSFHLP